MRLCKLREKNVINVGDCQCLGRVMDLELEEGTGCIKALSVPGPARFWGFFGRDCEFFIPWCNVIRIGPDIILVDVKVDEIKKRL